MNKVVKLGFGLAAASAVAFVAGCAGHTPVYQCGQVDYKSMASCKSSVGINAKKASCSVNSCKSHHYCKEHGNK